ncbi:MAG: hypothetical protein ACREBQ_02300 [Nitrososphaerales archaeon]
MRRAGLSSNLIAGLIVGSFVCLVVLGLIVANFGYLLFPNNSTTRGPGITFSAYQLFSGSSSTVSYTSTCNGDAYLVVDMHNNTPNNIHITDLTIYGSSLPHNSTTLLSVSSNSCLTLAQSNPEIPPNSDYEFVGYLTVGLQPLTNCYFSMQFDNGQQFSHLMVAQT